MRRNICAFALLFIVSFTGMAHSADMSVFGIELGKPLVLPKCSSDPLVGNKKMCVRNYWQEFRLYDKKVRIISFGKEVFPAYTRGALIPLEIDGNVEGIEIQSGGVSDQESMYQALCAKYGKPTKVEKTVVKNRIGAFFDAIDAEWTIGNVYVVMWGVFGALNEGRCTIDTAKGKALREEWLKSYASKVKKI
jgi:hypothetical protein